MKKFGAKPNKIEKPAKEKPPKTPWRDKAFPIGCIAPSFIGVMIFFIVPFIVILYYSVVDNPINKDFVFLDNYITLLHNSYKYA